MEAERREVTVLFTDMVGFTTFSEKSGEEAAFTLMRSLSNLMDDAVREQGALCRVLLATASWRSSAPQSRSRTPRYGPVAQHLGSSSTFRPLAPISWPSTEYSRKFGSASTLGPRWSVPCSGVLMLASQFSAIP